MFKIYGDKERFSQWELDQKVTNPHMKAGDQVCFRQATGATYVMNAYNSGGEVVADVPNILLQTAKTIVVDLGQGVNAHPECRTTFAVDAGEKPADYVYANNLKTGVAGSADWSENDPEAAGYVKNRTHYEETAQVPLDIVWDGVIDGRDSFSVTIGDSISIIFVKVFDQVLSDEDLKKCKIRVGEAFWDLGETSHNWNYVGESSVYYYDLAVVRNTSDNLFTGSNVSPAYAPSTGIYFGIDLEGRVTWRLQSDTLTMPGTVVHRLPEKYAPEIPFFDLAEMGLPTIDIDFTGEGSYAELNTVYSREFESALQKGAVRIRVALRMAMDEIDEIVVNCVAMCAPVYIEGGWQLVAFLSLSPTQSARLVIEYYEGCTIKASCVMIQHFTA